MGQFRSKVVSNERGGEPTQVWDRVLCKCGSCPVCIRRVYARLWEREKRKGRKAGPCPNRMNPRPTPTDDELDKRAELWLKKFKTKRETL